MSATEGRINFDLSQHETAEAAYEDMTNQVSGVMSAAAERFGQDEWNAAMKSVYKGIFSRPSDETKEAFKS